MSSSTFYASTSADPSNASSSSSSSAIPILPPLRCPLCPIHVHFPHDLALEAHLAQIHLGLRPFKCLECPPAAGLTNVDATSFPTEWAFLDHLAYAHGQYAGQSLLQIDLELVNKRRQIQRLITCAILTRESSRMVVGEQQQMVQQINNANMDISHFGQGNSLGMESDNLAQTSSNGQQNGKRVEVKIEVEEEETMEAINNVGNHQMEENGIKLECSTEGNEPAEQDQNVGPTSEHSANEQPCLSAAELEAAEILRTAAFKLSQSLLNRNRQQMEMTGPMMEWKDKGDGHQILEKEGLNEYVQNQHNENGGSQNDYSAGEEEEHWNGQQQRKKKLSKKRRQNSENGGGMKKKGMEKKMISEEEEKQIHQFVANLLKKEEKRRAEMKKEEEAKKRRRTTSENNNIGTTKTN